MPAATLKVVPRGDSSPSGSWVAVSARSAVLVYDTGKIKPAALPSSLLDLASPKWKGKVAIAPGETDSSRSSPRSRSSEAHQPPWRG